MKIRSKLLLIVLPLLIAALGAVGLSSYLQASLSATGFAAEYLGLMAGGVRNYAENQWNLIERYNAAEDPLMKAALRDGVENFSRGMLRSATETIFALDSAGRIQMHAGQNLPSEAECQALIRRQDSGTEQYLTITAAGQSRAAYTTPLAPLSWQLFVTEKQDVFLASSRNILTTTICILFGALIAASIIIFLLTGQIAKPAASLGNAMETAGNTLEFPKPLPVIYDDEIGVLTNAFNRMAVKISSAYGRPKQNASGGSHE